MNDPIKEKVKAVGLISGGLDSTLAAMVMKEAGLDVYGVYFDTGFCVTAHRREVRRKKDDVPEKMMCEVLRASCDVDIPIEIINISEEFMNIVIDPKHGYGSNVNPCIDCRIFMLKKAKEYADRIGAKFVFTGEVLGQRPMSQYRSALKLIEKQAGLEGYLLRPLSAQLLEPTVPEKEGWVDREKLLRISGRSRKEQLALCEKYGLKDLPQPAGGCCYLVDKNFARRFRDLISHRERGSVKAEDMHLLQTGRHFRFSYDLKAIVGRDERENEFLEKFKEGRWLFQALDCGSPLTLAEGELNEEQKCTIAALTVRYSSAREQDSVRVLCEKDSVQEFITVNKSDIKDFSEYIL